MGFQSKFVPEEILRVEDVTVKFGGFKALDCLNFRMERGELRVVIGPNGAGKTTLLDVITGKLRPHDGRVIFQAHDQAPREINSMSEEQIARLGVGRKFQTPNVFKSSTVLDNLTLAARSPRGVWSTLAGVFSRNGHHRVYDILQTHGEKQWLELGMLMAQDPELLLVDEPVAGMTPKESERTGELLLSMARKHTLLVIDHDMTFVRQIARTVTVLHEGKTLCQGTVQEVQRDPKVIQVYLGQDRQDHAVHQAAPSRVR